jgi:hypothetical protein
MITDDATTSRQTRGKGEERRQRTRGDGALMGIEKQRQSREDERWRHRRNDQPANKRLLRRRQKQQRRRWRWQRERPRAAITGIWRQLPRSSRLRLRPRSLRMTLMVPAEVAAALIEDDADGGNSGVAIVGRVSLAAGGWANKLIP